jgi:hypothetical protein
MLGFIFYKKIVFRPKFVWWLFVYALYLWLWSFANGYIEQKGTLKFLFTNLPLYSVFLLLIIYNNSYSDKFIRRVLLLTKFWFVILLIGQLLQFFYEPYFLVPESWIPGLGDNPSIYILRRPSVFALVSDHEYGISIMALFALYFGYVIKEEDRFPWFWIVIAILYSVLTNTRYIMLGVLLIFLQFNFVKIGLKKKLQYVFILAIIMSVSLYMVTKVFNYDFNEYAEERLFAEESIESSTRYFAITVFLDFFPKAPFLGNGQFKSEEVEKAVKGKSSQIHVGYLAHLVSYGIVGSIFLFSFWFAGLRFLYKRAKKTGFYGAFYAFLMIIWANVTLVTYEIFYVGIIFAFVFDKYYWDGYIISIKEKYLQQIKGIE